MPAASSFANNRYISESYDEFLFLCRHPLVSFLIHDITSLHPTLIQINDYSSCSQMFEFRDPPIKMKCGVITNRCICVII